MIVYGELLFAENWIIGSVLLYLTGTVHGIEMIMPGKRLRLLAGSALCGMFSLVIFLPVRMPMTMLLEAGFAVAVCAVTFGGGRDVWKKALTFLLITYFMGGMTMGLLLLTQNEGFYTAVGIYTGDMKAAMLALFIGIGTATVKQAVRAVSRKKFYGENICPVTMVAGQSRMQTSGFVDTGNGLREPISGKPVALADEALWDHMQSCGLLHAKRYCVVPYESVGGSGLLEAVRLDALLIGGGDGGSSEDAFSREIRRIKGCVVARSAGPLDIGEKEAAGCHLLLSRDMTGRKM